MEYINISHTQSFECAVIEASSEEDGSLAASNILHDTGFWRTRKKAENTPEYLILDFMDAVIIDEIEMSASPAGARTFPREFRFEESLDGRIWHVLHTEKNMELEGEEYRIHIPLSRIRYLKLFIIEHGNNEEGFYSEIGRIRAGICGIPEMKASSCVAGRGPENLLTADAELCWETESKPTAEKETLLIDLGRVYHVNRIIFGSGKAGFPENFHVETSRDGQIWITMFEEKGFKAEEHKEYFWNTDITPARFIRLEAHGVKHPDGGYGVRISSMEISAADINPYHTHAIGDMTPHSSIFQAGMVRLAKNGEEVAGTAVQGNDRRLKDATTIFKGIVQLADDGGESEGTALQASDSRLKPATELKPGIIRLALDRETKAGAAIQGNDSRLVEASAENYGIVKMCPDGMYRQNTAVSGDDVRLQKATEQAYGICRLAPDGGNVRGTVLQAHDKRLRDATTSFKGIVELAEDGEDEPDVAVQGNDKRLKSATTITKGIVELAEDGEDAADVAVQGNDRRLKNATETTKGIVRLAKDGEEKSGAAVQGNDQRLKPATVSSRGIVELAKDGESRQGVAVQGNDRRLREASETIKGIVKLAKNGESRPGEAVQGNDRRLKPATTVAMGIVELAEDGEDEEAVVVQGNDRRLKDATTFSRGIVALADDGEEKAGAAVQGNDRRLRDATEKSKGIVELAEDGEDAGDVVVQGNDKRLRDATTFSRGIVELAEDGEDDAGVVVQGNDKRLKNATTVTRGIVELAEDGEDGPGVAVQGSDRRLKYATENAPGIVTLAKSNESKPGCAVQSNDVRLNDARPPVPHDHEYAPLVHSFASHEGTISIRASRHEALPEITPPSDDSAIIYAKNESADSGSIGVSGVAGVSTQKNILSYGVVGHGGHIGVRGQSSGYEEGTSRGCGILGVSRFGAGGVFASEHDYSLYVDGYGTVRRYDDSLNLAGNGDALYVNGVSVFNGTIRIAGAAGPGEGGIPANIVELFNVDEEEYIMTGDILVAGGGGGSLSRSRAEYDRSCIGVVSGNPAVIIDNRGNKKKAYAVALGGTVLCRIDARNNPIRPGDLVVTSGTPGCGMAGKIDSLEKIGSVVGKSLDSLDDGIGVIPIFIIHL